VAAVKRPALPPRALAALTAGRLLGTASRRLGRGGGTALPGAAAERLDRSLTTRLALQLHAGRVLVTGTNGKTTTARLLAEAAAAAGRQPVHNRSGSNLMRGIGTALIESAGVDGRIPGAERRAAVFEVDEATLPYAVRAVRPTVVVFTNLFRDQLDRYGEVDSILALWQRSLGLLPSGTTLVLNADDPSVAGLGERWRGPVRYYGVNEPSGDAAAATGNDHAADARWCDRCGAEYRYDPIYYGHVGLWRCPGCGRARPQPDVAATHVARTGGGITLTLQDGDEHVSARIALSGLYNAYNALAAYAAAEALNIEREAILAGLERFTAAFGRQEQATLQGREVRLLLVKNPAGANQVIASVLNDTAPLHLLLALNDGVQDGRDVSWIWDVDFEQFAGHVAQAVAAGTRAADMGLRLKYAGLGAQTIVIPRMEEALRAALRSTPAGGILYVLPTYTAMLSLREMIAAAAGQKRFWLQ